MTDLAEELRSLQRSLDERIVLHSKTLKELDRAKESAASAALENKVLRSRIELLLTCLMESTGGSISGARKDQFKALIAKYRSEM